jgi:hypothetical protein
VTFVGKSLLESLQAPCPDVGTFQPQQITPVPNLAVCDHLTLTVVRSANYRRTDSTSEQLEVITAELLHNIVLSPGTVIYANNSPVAALYKIDRIYVHDCGKSALSTDIDSGDAVAWIVNRKSSHIHIRQQVSAAYIDALLNPSQMARVSGVDAVYNGIRLAILQLREHLLLCGPVGVGKASLVRAIAAELRLPLLSADCGELCGDEGLEGGGGLAGLFATAGQVAGESLADGDQPGTTTTVSGAVFWTGSRSVSTRL